MQDSLGADRKRHEHRETPGRGHLLQEMIGVSFYDWLRERQHEVVSPEGETPSLGQADTTLEGVPVQPGKRNRQSA